MRTTALVVGAVPLAGPKAAAQTPPVRIAPTILVSGTNASRQRTLPTPTPAAGISRGLSSSAPAVEVFHASGSDTISITRRANHIGGGAGHSAVPAVTRPVTLRAQTAYAVNASAQTTQLVVVPPPEFQALVRLLASNARTYSSFRR